MTPLELFVAFTAVLLGAPVALALWLRWIDWVEERIGPGR